MVARPVVTDAAERAYGALGPLRDPDEAHDYHLLFFVASWADRLQPVEDLSRDTDDGPGWSLLLDNARAPVHALPYQGQFVGVRVRGDLDEESQRLRIKETAGFARGTVGAIAGAARQLLTGTRQVEIVERDGSPYRLTVRTYAAETTDPDAVNAALQAEKPAGLVLTYEITEGATYQQLTDNFATYADLEAAFASYKDQTLYVPPAP